MIVYEELNQIMQDEEEPSVPQDDSFKVDTLERAVWADGKVKDAESKIIEIDQLADDRVDALTAKIEKIREWQEIASKPHISTIEFFRMHLELYLSREIRKQIDSSAKKITKSIILPFRKLVMRSQQPEIVKDDAELIKWVEANNPTFVKREPKLEWGEFKKTLKLHDADGKKVYYDSNGQEVPHITLIDREDTFKWELID